ncbi:MAG TPA: hypothetical protein VGQ83_43280 [Polyangia bacterium]|jgi:hypothetical protein
MTRLRALAIALTCCCLAACGDDSPAHPAIDAGTQDATPDAVPAPPALAVGDVVDLSGGGGGPLALAITTEAGTERYLAVLHAGTWASATADYGITAQRTPAAAALRVQPAAAAPGADAPAPAATRRSPAHLADLATVAAALRDGRARPARPLPRPAPPVENEVRDFRVLGDNRVAAIQAQAVHVTATLAVWLDITTQPLATISAADLTDVADTYANVVIPREHRFFGQESDIDQNGMVFVLMSAIVNENNGPVAYFFSCDLLAPDAAGCPAGYSNQAEVLYLTPPSAIAPPYNTARAILETMAHETNHMIYFNTKYLAQARAGDTDNMYLQEGLAAMAQDLTGYQAGNWYVAQAGLNDILDLSAYDILRDGGAYITSRDGAYRGAAYLLMRYLYDQAGGDHALTDGTFEDLGGIAYMQAVFNAPEVGLANLEARIARPLDDALFDFYTALAVTNRGPDHGPISADPRFNYRPIETDPITTRQRGFDAYSVFHGIAMTGPQTLPEDSVPGVMPATGVQYVAIDATDAGGVLTVTVDSPADWGTRARLCRIE